MRIAKRFAHPKKNLDWRQASIAIAVATMYDVANGQFSAVQNKPVLTIAQGAGSKKQFAENRVDFMPTAAIVA